MNLLQVATTSSTDTPQLLMYLFASLVGILISAAIFRWVLTVGHTQKIMKAQLKLLEQIAKANNVPEAEVKDIMNEINR